MWMQDSNIWHLILKILIRKVNFFFPSFHPGTSSLYIVSSHEKVRTSPTLSQQPPLCSHSPMVGSSPLSFKAGESTLYQDKGQNIFRSSRESLLLLVLYLTPLRSSAERKEDRSCTDCCTMSQSAVRIRQVEKNMKPSLCQNTDCGFRKPKVV